jgi:hypothetical protein
MLRDGKCTGRSGQEGACLNEIEIPLGERVMVSSVRATEGQLQKHLRDYVCDKDKRPALKYSDKDRLTIREVYGHQVVGAMAAERIELVEKPVYIIGGGLVEIGTYQATGRVITSYRDQQPTMLVDTLERLVENYQGFSVEKYRASLEKLRELDTWEIVEDISQHLDTGITRIDRIQNKAFESATRVIFNCNPKDPKKPWEQRTMDSFQYGCKAIKGIFAQMMVRRIDLVMFSIISINVNKLSQAYKIRVTNRLLTINPKNQVQN